METLQFVEDSPDGSGGNGIEDLVDLPFNRETSSFLRTWIAITIAMAACSSLLASISMPYFADIQSEAVLLDEHGLKAIINNNNNNNINRLPSDMDSIQQRKRSILITYDEIRSCDVGLCGRINSTETFSLWNSNNQLQSMGIGMKTVSSVAIICCLGIVAVLLLGFSRRIQEKWALPSLGKKLVLLFGIGGVITAWITFLISISMQRAARGFWGEDSCELGMCFSYSGENQTQIPMRNDTRFCNGQFIVSSPSMVHVFEEEWGPNLPWVAAIMFSVLLMLVLCIFLYKRFPVFGRSNNPVAPLSSRSFVIMLWIDALIICFAILLNLFAVFSPWMVYQETASLLGVLQRAVRVEYGLYSYSNADVIRSGVCGAGTSYGTLAIDGGSWESTVIQVCRWMLITGLGTALSGFMLRISLISKRFRLRPGESDKLMQAGIIFVAASAILPLTPIAFYAFYYQSPLTSHCNGLCTDGSPYLIYQDEGQQSYLQPHGLYCQGSVIVASHLETSSSWTLAEGWWISACAAGLLFCAQCSVLYLFCFGTSNLLRRRFIH